MHWFSRTLIIGLILCLSHTPIPWGHSHIGMNARQLSSHLRFYHPATRENDLPSGCHWHLAEIDLPTEAEGGTQPVAVAEVRPGELLILPLPEAAHAAVREPPRSSRILTATDTVSALAAHQQRTYLRLNMLLI